VTDRIAEWLKLLKSNHTNSCNRVSELLVELGMACVILDKSTDKNREMSGD